MTRTWLSIQVDLVEGHGEQYWPRPGRIFAAARSHSFKQLADAIDDAFARWDRSHLQEFTLTGQTHPQPTDPGLADLPPFRPDWGRPTSMTGSAGQPRGPGLG
jgi:hypothetical protein